MCALSDQADFLNHHEKTHRMLTHVIPTLSSNTYFESKTEVIAASNTEKMKLKVRNQEILIKY